MRETPRAALLVAALCWIAQTDAPWHWWPAAYGKGNTVYRHCADGCDRDVGPRWMAYPQAAGRVGKTGTLSTTAARSGPLNA